MISVWIAAQISLPPWFLDWLLPLNCTHLIETSLILKQILPEKYIEMVGISVICDDIPLGILPIFYLILWKFFVYK